MQLIRLICLKYVGLRAFVLEINVTKGEYNLPAPLVE